MEKMLLNVVHWCLMWFINVLSILILNNRKYIFDKCLVLPLEYQIVSNIRHSICDLYNNVPCPVWKFAILHKAVLNDVSVWVSYLRLFNVWCRMKLFYWHFTTDSTSNCVKEVWWQPISFFRMVFVWFNFKCSTIFR